MNTNALDAKIEALLISKGLVPLDKSKIIRIGVLDIIRGKRYCNTFLHSVNTRYLSNDILHLSTAISSWDKGCPINVGESATLYRFLRYTSWKKDIRKKILKQGTLKDRKIYSNKNVLAMTNKERSMLDNGTTQWVSAAILNGDDNLDGLDPISEKIKATISVRDRYEEIGAAINSRQIGDTLLDKTILKQMVAYSKLKLGRKLEFEINHSEDYCFARAFGLISVEEGQERFPSLASHESNRLLEMERCIDLRVNPTSDHRVLQAITMRKCSSFKDAADPACVNKSWPQFWGFMDYVGTEGCEGTIQEDMQRID